MQVEAQVKYCVLIALNVGAKPPVPRLLCKADPVSESRCLPKSWLPGVKRDSGAGTSALCAWVRVKAPFGALGSDASFRKKPILQHAS